RLRIVDAVRGHHHQRCQMLGQAFCRSGVRRNPASRIEEMPQVSNAAIYKRLGYDIVPFFVLDDSTEIKLIVEHGSCSAAIMRDLKKLTSRALVIRTDGIETPKHLREMLPRSDELRGATSAEHWLVGDFRDKVLKRTPDGKCLAESGLCLLAHHFVPAVASAWCRVVTVRLEDDLFHQLQRLSEARKAPMSGVIRDLLHTGIRPTTNPDSVPSKPLIDPLARRMQEETLGLAAMICVVVQQHFGQSHPHLREKTISSAWAEAERLRTRVKTAAG
ncbi:MAG: ribbon-helix-helix protein, CopG family, partial [Panacagrimonas sp.]